MKEYRNPVQYDVAEIFVSIDTTYTQLRDKLASVLDKVVEDQEIVIVRRRRGGDVALVPADELARLMETAPLLRSPRNARRLLTALRRAARRQGKPQTIDRLRRGIGVLQRRFTRTCLPPA